MESGTKAVKVNDLTVPDEKQPESMQWQKKTKKKKSQEAHSVGEYAGRRYTTSFRAEEIKAAGLSGWRAG